MKRVQEELFADGTGRLHFLGNMFRIELKIHALSDEETKEEYRIIMPPKGFLNMFQMMERIVKNNINTKKKEGEKERREKKKRKLPGTMEKAPKKNTEKSVVKQLKTNEKTNKKTSQQK